MDMGVAKEIFSFGNAITAIPLLLLGIWYFEKRFSKLEVKHDEEMARLRGEHVEIMKALKEEHQANLQAQRAAHMHEKTEFFGRLTDTLSELVRELKISNEERAKVVSDLSIIEKYQSEVRLALDDLKTTQHIMAEKQEGIKEILAHNGEILSAILKCDMNEKGWQK